MGPVLILIATLALGLLALLSLPVRLIVTLFRRRVKGHFHRCVILGFDGMDPCRATALMDAGRLPHLARLRATGTFTPLATTCPPISPVAWSTFATGVNPGKHGIFDFLNRDLRTCLPELSSVRVTPKGVEQRRKSRPFWHLLGEQGIFATILRVPISYPPERFQGLSLSGMCAPDIRGTQGEFTLFQSADVSTPTTGGLRIQVQVKPGRAGRQVVESHLPGPTLRGKERSLPLTLTWKPNLPSPSQKPLFPSPLRTPLLRGEPDSSAELRISGRCITLQPGVYSPWVRLTFRAGLIRVNAIARFLLIETSPGFRLYVTPLNIDPARPALPISWPPSYSVYLAKLLGPFATLGLAEDTWALTAGVLDDEAFLRQAHDIHTERENIFLSAVRRTRRGLCVCVFDLTDRIQHTFMRARTAEGNVGNSAIEESYECCDRLLGRTLASLGPDDLLFVVSDHGFTSFARGVNVNAWLRDQGYLVLKQGAGNEEYLRSVDWTRTRAYSFGLAGLYLNLAGRETQGMVQPGAAAQALKGEIAARLRSFADPATGRTVVCEVYDSATAYNGPYIDRAPDLVIGWRSGYRHSWETAVGRTDGPIFTDNPGKWCGDHCVDRTIVPGVLFCNRKLNLPDRGAHLADIAPTVLSLWHVPTPNYMDGQPMDVLD
jgi:predicted AlkP superfamily phosphohydrolase/phosphomutase